MKKILIASMVATALLASGCSSIVSKSEYNVSINSSPDGAKFTITNKNGINVYKGMTPASVNLKAGSGFFVGEEYTVTLKKLGHATEEYTITSGIDGWYFGNVLFGGLIGLLIVDPATGAMFSLPDHVNFNMEEETKHVLTIQDINELTDEEKAKLYKLN